MDRFAKNVTRLSLLALGVHASLALAQSQDAQQNLTWGNSAMAPSGSSNTTIGTSAGQMSTGNNNTFIGAAAGQNINGNNNQMFGSFVGAGTVGNYNFFGGDYAARTTTGSRNLVIGHCALVSGNGQIGMAQSGCYTNRSGDQKGSFTGSDNVVFGTNAGIANSATGVATNNTVVIGNMSMVRATGAVALGHNSDATLVNSVALGAGSIANTAGGIAGFMPVGATSAQRSAIANTISNSAAVSVGGNGIRRQITNVAAGTADTDAVNVAQLKALTVTATAAKSTVAAGDNIDVTSTIDADGATNYVVATKRNVSFDSVANGGISIDGVSNVLTGLAAGDLSGTSTDAVNGSQLFATNTAVSAVSDLVSKGLNFGNGKASRQFALGDTINVAGDANVLSTMTANGVQLSLGQVLNIGSANPVIINGNAGTVGGLTNTKFDALKIVSGQAATEDQVAQVNAAALAAKSTVAAGENIAVTSTVNADGSTDYVVATKRNVSFDSVAIGGIRIDGVSNVLTGLAPGVLSATSTDAVNGSQLFATNTTLSKLSSVVSEGISVGDGTSSKKYSLGDTIDVKGDANVLSTMAANGLQLSLGNVLNIGSANPVVINGNAGTVGGLSNTKFDVGNIVSGQAATEDQLAQVSAQASASAAASKSVVGAGENIEVTSKINADGSTDYLVSTKRDVTFGSIAIGGIRIDGVSNVLTGLAPGVLSATSTDAVNGSQLFATNTTLSNLSALANKGINFGNGTSSNNFALGSTIEVAGDTNIISSTSANGVQLSLGHVLNIGLANPIIINGNAGTISGLTNTKFDPKNIISGQAATEDQLAQVSAEARASAAAARSTVSAGDNIAVTSSVKADGSTDYEVALKRDVDFDSVTTAGLVVKEGAGIYMGSNVVGGVAAGSTAADSNDAVNGGQLNQLGSSIANGLGGNSSFDPASGTVKIDLNVGGKPFDNVNDALNSVSAIASSGWNLSANGGAASKIAPGTTVDLRNADGNIRVIQSGTSLTFDVAKNLTLDSINVGNATLDMNGLIIKNGPSVTAAGIDGGGKQIHNVQAGTAPTDAVNVAQLNAGLQGAIDGANRYTDMQIAGLQDQLWAVDGRVNQLRSDMHAGVATAMSVKSAPYVAGKTTMAAGVAGYKGQAALGVSFRRTADNGRWSLDAGFSRNRDGSGAYLGFSTVLSD